MDSTYFRAGVGVAVIDHEGRVVWGRYRDQAGVDHGFVATLGTGGTKHREGRRSEKMHAAFTVEDCAPGSKRQVCRELERGGRE